MNSILFSSPFNKALTCLSSLALLLLVIRPNVSAIATAAVWSAFVVLIRFKVKAEKFSLSGWILCMSILWIFVLLFYEYWRNSSQAQTMATVLSLDIRVLLGITATFLGISAAWVLTGALSAFSDYYCIFTNERTAAERRGTLKELLIIVFTAILTITIFSKSSPCYPLNDWMDTNIFLTVGKSLLHGKVLYVDVYEQKGPLLFFVFTIPALISETSFTGVYFLEIISAVFFLYYSNKIARYFSGEEALFFLPAYACIIYSTKAFSHGGSVEELFLPMHTAALYYLVDMLKGNVDSLTIKRAFIEGIFIGCIFWVKYTMLGLFIGLALIMTILCCQARKFFALWRTALAVILGILLVSLPILLYFASNHALQSLWEVYFYNNMFYYGISDNESVIRLLFTNCLLACLKNIDVFWIIMFGTFMLAAENKKLFFSWLICLGTAAAFIYYRNAYMYYSFLLCAFAPVGYGYICRILSRVRNMSKRKGISAVLSLLCMFAVCIISFNSSSNKYLFGELKGNLPQYKMAEIINKAEDKTILNYGTLDIGLYTATGTVPNTRFFCKFNVEAPGQSEEQERYISEGIVNFVVTKDHELNATNYTLVDTESYYLENREHIYYLYRRNTDDNIL